MKEILFSNTEVDFETSTINIKYVFYEFDENVRFKNLKEVELKLTNMINNEDVTEFFENLGFNKTDTYFILNEVTMITLDFFYKELNTLMTMNNFNSEEYKTLNEQILKGYKSLNKKINEVKRILK